MENIGTTINESPVITMKASTALTGIQGKALAVSSGKLAFPSKGAAAIGVALMAEEANAAADADVVVQIKDICKWVSAGSIAVGAFVTTDANGKAITAEAGDFIMGIALTASAAAGTIISVQLTKSGYVPAAE